MSEHERETKRVEYRWLQYIVSHLSGDRSTVGLLHWDGQTLRSSFRDDAFGPAEPMQRQALHFTLVDIRREVGRVARHVDREARLDFGLKELFAVREGLGAALYWAPVGSARVSDPAAHFVELCGLLRLEAPAPPVRDPSRLTREVIRGELLALGERFYESYPTQVDVEHSVRRIHEYRAPLSWLNGGWHHTVPFSLASARGEKRHELVQRLIGMIDLSIPRGHVPVVVAALPALHETLPAEVASEEARLREALGERNAKLVVASPSSEGVDFGPLVGMIETDIGHRLEVGVDSTLKIRVNGT
jgi:hypothetical protein